MIVIFQGMESADHRATLESIFDMYDEDPPITVALSYRSMKSRRTGAKYVNSLSERFQVVLEAGMAHAPLNEQQSLEWRGKYYDYLAGSSSIISAIQYDHPAMGDHDMPDDDRLVPVLFDHDPKVLLDILEKHGSVAMAPDYGEKRHAPVLRRFQDDYGLLIALSECDLALAKKTGYNAVMTLAWTYPSRFGELMVWDATTSKFHRRYTKDRDEFMAHNSHLVEKAGFDVDLVVKRDARESNRLAAWSLLEYSRYLQSQVSDTEASSTSEEDENAPNASKLPSSEVVKRSGASKALPVFSTSTTEALEVNDDGTQGIRSTSVLHTSGASQRRCDSCFLATSCPEYEKGAACAYAFPVQIRTDAQLRAALHSMVELQVERVAFARFAEELNGGYPDPVVGQEMDRLVRIAERIKKHDERKNRLTVSVESETSGGSSAGGVLSAIFGSKPEFQPEPEQSPHIMGQVIE